MLILFYIINLLNILLISDCIRRTLPINLKNFCWFQLPNPPLSSQHLCLKNIQKLLIIYRPKLKCLSYLNMVPTSFFQYTLSNTHCFLKCECSFLLFKSFYLKCLILLLFILQWHYQVVSTSLCKMCYAKQFTCLCFSQRCYSIKTIHF